MLHTRLLAAAAAAVALSASPAHPQPQPVLPRPELPRGADVNDWQSYYELGMRTLRTSPRTADAAFYWALRLDPSRGEPRYGMWGAFHLRDIGRWERYMDDSPAVLRDPAVVRADSLADQAFLRNPFVHRGMVALLWEQVPNVRWRGNLGTQGWLAYARGDYGAAVRFFGRVVERDPARNYHWRFERALAFTAMARHDSAIAELEVLLENARRVDSERLVRWYESKDRLEYALGVLHMARKDLTAARAAMERALVENAAMWPARAALGQISLAQNRPSAAVREYEQAVEIEPGDADLRFQYGTALAGARRYDEAMEQLRRAADAEPYYATVHLQMGAVYERQSKGPEALAAYRRYLELAPQSQAATVQRIRQRVDALERAAAAATP